MSTSQAPAVQPDVGAQHAKGAVEQAILPSSPERSLIDAGVKEALRNGVGMFARNAMAMTNSFEEVVQLLQRVNKADLLNEWQALQKDCRERLWESRDLATQIASNTEQFEKSVLPLVKGADKREVIQVLKRQMDNCEQIVRVSDNQTRRAQDQRRALARFLEKLEQWNNDNFITRQLRRRILEVVHQESMLRKRVGRLCHRAGLHYIITNVISPRPEVVWRAADVSSLPQPIKQEMQKLRDEFRVLQEELSRSQESLHKAEDELSNSELSKAYFRVRRLEDEQAIRFIMSLHTFGVFPEGEVHDCKALIEYLENQTHMRRPMILKAFEENRNTIYGTIAEAASKYATGIQSQQ